MRRPLGVACALALATGAIVTPAAAQASGSFQARATVLPAITVNGTADLRFGTVLPTQTRTIAPTSASAGRFVLSMPAHTPVAITYTLPASLGPNLTVSNYQGRAGGFNFVFLATPFSLPAGTGTVTASTPTGALYLWLGATLTTTNAAPGFYSAPITLTVVYN